MSNLLQKTNLVQILISGGIITLFVHSYHNSLQLATLYKILLVARVYRSSIFQCGRHLGLIDVCENRQVLRALCTGASCSSLGLLLFLNFLALRTQQSRFVFFDFWLFDILPCTSERFTCTALHMNHQDD